MDELTFSEDIVGSIDTDEFLRLAALSTGTRVPDIVELMANIDDHGYHTRFFKLKNGKSERHGWFVKLRKRREPVQVWIDLPPTVTINWTPFEEA